MELLQKGQKTKEIKVEEKRPQFDRVIYCALTGRWILKGEDGLYSPVRVPQTERPG